MPCLQEEWIKELLDVDLFVDLSVQVFYDSLWLNSLKDANDIILDDLDWLHLHNADVFVDPELVVIDGLQGQQGYYLWSTSSNIGMSQRTVKKFLEKIL